MTMNTIASSRILFMGTPDFAVPSLKILVDSGFQVIAVVTQPDRPKGRGRQTLPSPVKQYAGLVSIPVLQPEKVRAADFLDIFAGLAPDMVVVAAFGQILPKQIIEAPPLGCLNVHASLLPKYRGAAPLNWAIINGEDKTGITIMLMDEGMDTGDILLQQETVIGLEEAYGSLHDRMMGMGAALLLKAVKMRLEGAARRIKQDNLAASYAPRMKKEDGLIDWSRDMRSIVNLIRGLSPAPGAYTFLDGKQVKILQATGKQDASAGIPGHIGVPNAEGLPVRVKDGYVFIRDMQMENKKRMSVHDFLRGYILRPNSTMG